MGLSTQCCLSRPGYLHVVAIAGVGTSMITDLILVYGYLHVQLNMEYRRKECVLDGSSTSFYSEMKNYCQPCGKLKNLIWSLAVERFPI